MISRSSSLCARPASHACLRTGTIGARTHVGRPKTPSRIGPRILAKQGGMGDEDMDVAVFRFTLGIPGFEDRLIPRFVAGGGAALLGINHILSFGMQATPIVAQGSAELLCGALILVLALVPDIEDRLREAQPGRGRQSSAASIPDSTNAFLLDKELADKSKQELAWASFALLKNTNSCGIVLQRGDRALMARGALGSTVVVPGATEQSLANFSKDINELCQRSSEISAVVRGQGQQLWLPDRQAMDKAGLSSCASIPRGAECLLVQRVGPAEGMKPANLLMIFSERPRALSDRERTWTAAVAKKLSTSI